MANKKVVGTDYIPANNAQSNPQSNQQRKPKRAKKTSRKTFWLLKASPGVAIITLIFIISMSLVAQHVWINFLGYKISILNKSISDTQESNEKLKLQIASLGSLDRIEEVAVNKLGMVYPENVQYIFSQDTPQEKQTSIQIAGFDHPNIQNVAEPVEEASPKKAWLGTVQDFFFNYLMGESKS